MADKLSVQKYDERKLLEILEKARLWDEMQNREEMLPSNKKNIDDNSLEY